GALGGLNSPALPGRINCLPTDSGELGVSDVANVFLDMMPVNSGEPVLLWNTHCDRLTALLWFSCILQQKPISLALCARVLNEHYDLQLTAKHVVGGCS